MLIGGGLASHASKSAGFLRSTVLRMFLLCHAAETLSNGSMVWCQQKVQCDYEGCLPCGLLLRAASLIGCTNPPIQSCITTGLSVVVGMTLSSAVDYRRPPSALLAPRRATLAPILTPNHSTSPKRVAQTPQAKRITTPLISINPPTVAPNRITTGSMTRPGSATARTRSRSCPRRGRT